MKNEMKNEKWINEESKEMNKRKIIERNEN